MADRTIHLYKDYFKDFYLSQSDAVRNKINYCLNMVKTLDRVPTKILKYMEGTDGLYEIRIEMGSNIFRVFCCFDDGALVILFNGFHKKTQKTPTREIAKALRLKKEYFEEKKYGKD